MKRALCIMVTAVFVLGGCGNDDSASKRALGKAADKAAINQLEVLFHQAASAKDIDKLMSLWADDAVMTVGGQTFTGKAQIRDFWFSKSGPFRPENNWVSETPAYKIRVTANGDRGTLYFECHYVDVDSHVIKAAVSATVKVARHKDQWMFTNLVAAPATVS